jgi:hypothetical protein
MFRHVIVKNCQLKYIMQYCGSASARIWKFLTNPELEVLVPAPDPELGFNFKKNHSQNMQFVNYNIQNYYDFRSHEKRKSTTHTRKC